MAAGFRANIFDPILIILQIISLFCFYCFSLCLWLVVANTVGGTQNSVDQLFDYREFEGTYEGWLVMGAVALNSFTTGFIMSKVVRRAKQCVDFSVTVFVTLLVVSLCYGGLPRSWAWWLTHLASTAITAVVGEYLCMRAELAIIPLSSGSLGKT